ncbi:glycosyltransferase family 2 protein [Polaromonas sp. SM01]|uniref:glycosyltransferase family 2 protein n=1 Tax=Polaromonas sp. SM01 TaxID=3085630 RepID=UPI002981876D|nr:glycosyltransferase family 2 protein [Polaromonas sp. SM01]MDW5441556.1 glycosyltransferase family 2 protein [Polaromonas sp. SM01]
MSLSVIIITKNEEANLQACLESVRFADQWVVVDSASTDNTRAIASAFGAEVTTTQTWPGFGPQKNLALGLATQDWVLSLDADERVTPELAAEIRQAMQTPGTHAFEIPRLTQFCGQWIQHCGWTPDHVLRLFRRGQAEFSNDLVHERVILKSGTLARLKSQLLHYSYPTPAHYWRKLAQYSQAWAEQAHARGKTSSMPRAVTSGLMAFLKSYIFRLGILDGSMGFAVCAMQAQAAFGKYFTLYCLNQKNASRKN